jgi:hypothetical protein
MRILRGLGSRRLACECVVGIYETYDGAAVAILDVRDAGCTDAQHQRDAEVDLRTAPAAQAHEESDLASSQDFAHARAVSRLPR